MYKKLNEKLNYKNQRFINYSLTFYPVSQQLQSLS